LVVHHRLERRVDLKWRVPGNEFPGDTPDGIQIGPRAVLPPLALPLLGRHVQRRTGGRRQLGSTPLVLLADGVDDPEIGEFDALAPLTVREDQEVLGLQIAVDDAAGVGEGERIEDLEE
jgi:hypothetical protein